MTNKPKAKELTAAERAAEIRKHREFNPTDGLKRRLPLLPERSGFERRWVNDTDNRINMFLKKGWTFVELSEVEKKSLENPTDSRISVYVGRDEGGKPIHAYAMEVPQEISREDRKLSQKPNEDRMAYIEGAKAGDDVADTAAIDQEGTRLQVSNKTIESSFTPD